ncbi:glycoside hydrolase [Sphingomonas carotinifaciens]|uniref:glycoside hydrolase n=1 Tax=Sphingomonas carotinifaciens TaxID=1166323 RepID=UPI001F0809C6|nr:glycoside hydrolase [Sphingomonas carotinifaciens]
MKTPGAMIAMLLASQAVAQTPADPVHTLPDYAAAMIGKPPAALKLDPFYTRYVDAHGIPIAASRKVPSVALLFARDIVEDMLTERPDLRHWMIARGLRIAIMATEEGTTDLPEQRDWKKPERDDPALTRCERKHYDVRIGALTDAQYWNGRARGMGGMLTSGATENLLAIPGTSYYGENIFVHEFSHAILNAVEQVDPLLYQRVERAYAAAMAAGLWKGEYGSTTVHEYWAEGTQYWFNSNMVARFGAVTVLSDADLRRYDPALSDVLREVYGDRHRLTADLFFEHPARVPPGPAPAFTAEEC